MKGARAEAIIERIDLLALHLRSLFDRIDVHDSVARELRVEAAAASHELGTLRKELENDIVRQRIRRNLSASAILRAARDRRPA